MHFSSSSLTALLAAAVFVSGAAGAILSNANANIAPTPRADALAPRQTESECNFVECIVTLAELPLSITACAETLKDLNEAPSEQDPIKTATQGADCIAEASLAGEELPEHCAGCTKALDGECPRNKIPCTGPPAA